jgi:hypothetical protein
MNHYTKMVKKYERMNKKISPAETWELLTFLNLFILPRLENFREKAGKIIDMEWDGFGKKLNEAIEAFKILDRDNIKETCDKIDIIQKGLHSFADIYQGLWY